MTPEFNILINDKYEKLLVSEEERKLKLLLMNARDELKGDKLVMR